MDRVLSFTTHEESDQANAALDYWRSRPPQERIAEVERLREEYVRAIQGEAIDGSAPGLRGPMLFVERERG